MVIAYLAQNARTSHVRLNTNVVQSSAIQNAKITPAVNILVELEMALKTVKRNHVEDYTSVVKRLETANQTKIQSSRLKML